MRVMFVDDDAGILNAMRRTLHGMRAEWSMTFFPNGPEALAAMAAAPADVVVTDMRMPGMDGWQLLAEVKDRFPQTVRLLLSGHADPSCIMRCVGLAHQYLAKPCDSGSLKAAIRQALGVRQLLSSESLARLACGVGMLPGAPLIFQRLLACLRAPQSSVVDVARIIEGDVAMTANIMKLVNSAFFGSRQTFVNIERAIAYLGLDTVSTLVLGHDVFQAAADRDGGFDHEQLWRHSLQTAHAARDIALRLGLESARAEEAFLAGVLHDVGKLVLALRQPATGAGPGVEPAGPADDVRMRHAEVGAYLLGLWGFPCPIIEAVAYHHEPSRAGAGEFGLAGIIHVANQMTHHLYQTGGSFDLQLEEGYLEQCGVEHLLPEWSSAAAAPPLADA